MDYIKSFLTGELDAKSFIHELNSNADLQNKIRNLVLKEDANNRESGLWDRISFDALKSYDFDTLSLITARYRLDNSIGDNLNLHGTLRQIYGYYHPSVVCTRQYDDVFDIYLDAIQDCFDGPEVGVVVEQIILEAINSSNVKTRRRSSAKAMVKGAFHVVNRNRPRWIQGPEWPMGKDSPMQFVEQKRKGEEVHYLFRDIITGETRTVVQWF